MILELKVNYFELLEDGKVRMAANAEEFKAMLDGVNPRISTATISVKNYELQITNRGETERRARYE